MFLISPRDWSASVQENGSGRSVGKPSGWLTAENYTLEAFHMQLPRKIDVKPFFFSLFFIPDICNRTVLICFSMSSGEWGCSYRTFKVLVGWLSTILNHVSDNFCWHLENKQSLNFFFNSFSFFFHITFTVCCTKRLPRACPHFNNRLVVYPLL